MRETLYDELSPGRRVRLHRRIADVLEAMYGPAVGDAPGGAGLPLRAGDGSPGRDGDVDDDAPVGRKAIEYARRAGDQATARARLRGGRAPVPDGARRSWTWAAWRTTDAQTETLLALGDVQTRTGDLDAARTTFLEAAEIARRTGRRTHLARAALGFGGRHQWARPGNDGRLIPLLQDALVLLGGQDETPAGPPPDAPRLRVAQLARAPDDSDTLSRQAIEIARRLDDPATLVYTLTGRFWATWWPENPDERQAIAGEVLVDRRSRSATASGSPTPTSWPS